MAPKLREITVTEGKCPLCEEWHILNGAGAMPHHEVPMLHLGKMIIRPCPAHKSQPSETRKIKMKMLTTDNHDEEINP